MTSETPCLPGCYTTQFEPADHFGERVEHHADGCPNAPKPAEVPPQSEPQGGREMTDPKPATPAADGCICEDIRVLGACPVHEPRSTEPANDNLVAAWLADLQGMDDADREHDVTVLDTRSLLLRIAADAEIIKAERARADKYEAESEQKGADLMAAEGTIEDLKAAAALADAIIEDNDATRTIRDLRETVRKQAEEIERLRPKG